MARCLVSGAADGPVIVFDEGLSFWGGVDAATGTVIDAHHRHHGQPLAGRVVMMPTSRGSSSGSGVLLELALNGRAPAALLFREDEDVLTLGSLIAERLFDRPIAVLRLSGEEYGAVARSSRARITRTRLEADGVSLPVAPPDGPDLELAPADAAMLNGDGGRAQQVAMETLCAMARVQGAGSLIDVSRVHIDGCHYDVPANLRFAETMAEMGARVRVPTTLNALSVDRANWRSQGVPPAFGEPAGRTADAYVRMGAEPSFTCAPYLLDARPGPGEAIAWAESNAAVYANSVLGARTVKHPDYLDLCIALTGRAPYAGVYVEANRAARRVIEVELPDGHDDALWPLLGWLAGRASPDRVPLLRGLEASAPSEADLKALCAAFGTTSSQPLLHVSGVTPEGDRPPAAGADTVRIARADLARAWRAFNGGDTTVDLVALGNPHFSLAEVRAFAGLMAGRRRHGNVSVIVTLGRATLAAARDEGLVAALEGAGVRLVADVCWCLITEPVFPPEARVLMTNSGKYAHYAPGLSGRGVRFGSLADCAAAAQTGRAPAGVPAWLA